MPSSCLGTWVSIQIYTMNLYTWERWHLCSAYGNMTNSKQFFSGFAIHSFLISVGSKSLINSCYETVPNSGVKPWMSLCHFQTKHSGFSVTPLRFSRTSHNNASLTNSMCYITKGRSESIALPVSLKHSCDENKCGHLIEETLGRSAGKLKTDILCRNQFLT